MFEEDVANAWKDINQELIMKPTVVTRPLLEMILNLARAIDFINKDDDNYTHCYLGSVLDWGVIILKLRLLWRKKL